MSDVVVDAVYGESDTVKMDPMGFGDKLPDDEQELVIERLDTMYKEEQANGMSAEELKEYEKLIVSMAAFVNVDVKIVNGSVVPG